MVTYTEKEKEEIRKENEAYERELIRIRKFDLNKASSEISNNVYKACSLFETLEHMEKVRGNGHHMAQKVCEFAEKLMRERWIKE